MRKVIAVGFMAAAATVVFAPTQVRSQTPAVMATASPTLTSKPVSTTSKPPTSNPPTSKPATSKPATTRTVTAKPTPGATAGSTPTPAKVKAPAPVPGAKPVAVAVRTVGQPVRVGTEVGYRISVTNQGERPVRLAVEAYLPSRLRVLEPTVDGGRARWWVTLGPGAGQELSLTGRYDGTAGPGEPVEVVACAYSAPGGTALACGGRIDILRPTDLVGALTWLGLGAGGTAVGAAWVAVRRRRTA